MSRVHPTKKKGEDSMSKEKVKEQQHQHPSSVLTVWKRSSMSFQGTDGFTVFDHHGKLAFRVDNYSRKSTGITGGGGGGGGVVLMDGAGNALLTLKPQMQVFSMHCPWSAYRGDGSSKSNVGTKPKLLFSMRSASIFNGGKDEAEIFMAGHDTPDFKVQGCFRRRNCIIRDSTGAIAARIARKKVNKTVLLGDDVFALMVQPGFHAELIMAFVIILDRIHVKPFTPFLCS
ncbi:hypothetical protein L6164_002547 [Bauhinia variegata]|uniref:Uncharacterized protein n=1 Tax=Bauhinia variegata TaxID=167791 RepID=A0ACB9Q0P4_BAUVA|nr:hypothetical protein L6164_002547 [Bauhinia variegata]